jgi:hypothetical protein
MEAIARGYRFECSCGELSKSVEIAKACRKCRTYAPESSCTEVYDLSTGEMVWQSESVKSVEKDSDDYLEVDTQLRGWRHLQEQ